MREMLVGSKVALAGCLMVLISACAPVEVAPPPTLPPAPTTSVPVLYEWHPEGLSGEPSIVIDLRIQRADIYLGGQYAGWTVVATGKEGYDTPAGDYKILEKVVDKHSTLYGRTVDAEGNTVNPDADARKHSPPLGGRFVYAPMPYWMRLTWRGIGMHAGPIPRPGNPASHGCIRLPRDFAIQLYKIVRIGTPVRIVR
ncbi:MAG TPA: L,D-transpeptidase family protein [Terrimicrobiaceae bacterium]|nr:L,D-transpeptidase family protein [Terrimicrobiaceae bacterium]